MELLLILRILLRRWWLIVIPVAVAAVFAVPDLLRDAPSNSGGYSTVIRYTASQVLEAIPGRDGDYQDVWLASELTVNAFTEWVRSSRFAEEVAQVSAENGLTIDPAVLSIQSDNERSIGQIFINWANEAELTAITNAAMMVLQTRSQNYFPQLGEVPAQVEILDDPRISPVPVSLPNRFRPLLQLGVALIGGIGLAFLVEYLDPTLRDRQALEALGLPIVATIPKK
jgi:capsular polysaccharide biosynthesis protein